MKRLILPFALVLALALPAMAQDDALPDPLVVLDEAFALWSAEDLAGYREYMSAAIRRARQEDSYATVGGLNHLAVFTEEPIDAVEERVKEAGFTPINHNDDAPGRRFYFHDGDGIEWEVASHQA